jgi:hypothetical protein
VRIFLEISDRLSVTFSSDVNIIGDGTKDPKVISGDKFNDQKVLLEIGKQSTVENTLENSMEFLKKRLFNIQESGSTALGPALLASIGMCQNYTSSKIILATDGLSNTGVGAMDDQDTDDKKDLVEQFYQNLGILGQEHGINISILR